MKLLFVQGRQARWLANFNVCNYLIHVAPELFLLAKHDTRSSPQAALSLVVYRETDQVSALPQDASSLIGFMQLLKWPVDERNLTIMQVDALICACRTVTVSLQAV